MTDPLDAGLLKRSLAILAEECKRGEDFTLAVAAAVNHYGNATERTGADAQEAVQKIAELLGEPF